METHLSGCARCRSEVEEIRAGVAGLHALPLAKAPDSLWRGIEAGLNQPAPRREPLLRWQLAVGLAGVAAVMMAAWWYVERPRGQRWEVARLEGSPVVGSAPMESTALIGDGESIETDDTSRARIQVGEIGAVDVEPSTRVTVLTASPQEHRLALHNGAIVARISAPPRLFFVETASVTAIDLGCEYTLRCDKSGLGMLRVQAGWVLLERDGRESLVPAGAVCRMRPRQGAGTPYFEDAPEPLVEALDAFDSESGGSSGLSAILAEARTRDTLTLWHLLSRVSPEERVRVYDRMAALAPPPQGISRRQVLDLDPASLTRWREELAWIW